jgi:multicomponent Na+:H+ antiporter subunit G
MDLTLGVVSAILLVGGAIFSVIGGVGLLRLPDFFMRLHGVGITDTMGAGFILVGLMFEAGLSLATVKLVMILFFLWITSPTSAHALAKAALTHGLSPRVNGKETPPSNR